MRISKNLSFGYDMAIIAEYYLIFAMLFMQLRGKCAWLIAQGVTRRAKNYCLGIKLIKLVRYPEKPD